MVAEFPVELQDHVKQDLAPDSRALANVALVCRRWRDILRHILLSYKPVQVTIGNFDDTELYAGDGFTFGPHARILNLHGWKDMHFWPLNIDDVQDLVGDHIHELTEALPHLHTLNLRCFYWYSLTPGLLSELVAATKITHLSLDCVKFDTINDFVQFLSTFHFLEELTMENFVIHSLQLDTSLLSNLNPPKFHHLNIKFGDYYLGLSEVFLQSSIQLSTLHLRAASIAKLGLFKGLIEHIGPVLSDLTLEASAFEFELSISQEISLAQNTHLRSLNVHCQLNKLGWLLPLCQTIKSDCFQELRFGLHGRDFTPYFDFDQPEWQALEALLIDLSIRDERRFLPSLHLTLSVLCHLHDYQQVEPAMHFDIEFAVEQLIPTLKEAGKLSMKVVQLPITEMLVYPTIQLPTCCRPPVLHGIPLCPMFF